MRNVLSSPTKSPAHNTNSQEPAAFNYSHLADTFIQNTFPIPPRWVFFFFLNCCWPQWEWKPSPPSAVLDVRASGAAGITWLSCALLLTHTFFSLYFPRSYTWEGAFWGAQFKSHSSCLCLFSINFICKLWRSTFKESTSSIRKNSTLPPSNLFLL